jgi:hypothetical protein
MDVELICVSPEKYKKAVLNKTKDEIIKDKKPMIRLNLIGKSEKGAKDISKKLNITPNPNGC